MLHHSCARTLDPGKYVLSNNLSCTTGNTPLPVRPITTAANDNTSEQRAAVGSNLPPSAPPAVVQRQDLTSLEQQEWYWGSTSVLDINDRLRGTMKPDGSFLVCDSETEGEYDLCAQMGGANGFVHISYCNRTYGFFDYSCYPPRAVFKFPTVPAFVEHFKQVPLKIRTADDVYLDVTLTHPILGMVSI